MLLQGEPLGLPPTRSPRQHRTGAADRIPLVHDVTCGLLFPRADALDLRDRFSDLATAGHLNEALALVRAVVRANRSDVLIRSAAGLTHLNSVHSSDVTRSCQHWHPRGWLTCAVVLHSPCVTSRVSSPLQAEAQAFPAAGGRPLRSQAGKSCLPSLPASRTSCCFGQQHRVHLSMAVGMCRMLLSTAGQTQPQAVVISKSD